MMQLDHERLMQARTKTTVSGQYLLAWGLVGDYMKRNNMTINLDEYLVTFDEDEGSYYVYFTKPFKQRVLGGGGAKAEITKGDMRVHDFKFGR